MWRDSLFLSHGAPVSKHLNAIATAIPTFAKHCRFAIDICLKQEQTQGVNFASAI
jgi:hypothetical protein